MYLEATILPQVHSNSRATRSHPSSAPDARKSRSESPGGARGSADSSKEQPGPSSKRDPAAARKTAANGEKPQQKAQEGRWASPRRQLQQQAPVSHPSSSTPSSAKDDVTGEAGTQQPQQSAEKESAPTVSSDNDTAGPDDSENKSQEPDGVVTKNGYIRVIRVVGKQLF